MGKKVSLVLVSTVITLFFLAMSLYQWDRVFSGSTQGDALTGVQISGWTSVVLFLLGSWSIILVLRSDTTLL